MNGSGEELARPSPRPEHFEQFYRSTYSFVVKVVVMAGATLHEAQDAADDAMSHLYPRWGDAAITNPRAYASRSALNYFVKHRKRDQDRVLRLVSHEMTRGAQAGPDVNAWEDRQWVLQLLSCLPLAQREVMACVVDGLSTAEMAQLLGKNESAIRKNLQWARQRLRVELAARQEQERLLLSTPSRGEP